MLQKLGRHTLRVDSRSHEIMTFVTQHTNDFRRQCFVQYFDDGLAVRTVTLGHRALFNMLARAFAQGLDVSKKWFVGHGFSSRLISHDFTPLKIEFRGRLMVLASKRLGKLWHRLQSVAG